MPLVLLAARVDDRETDVQAVDGEEEAREPQLCKHHRIKRAATCSATQRGGLELLLYKLCCYLS